jgi:hypothetical protein
VSFERVTSGDAAKTAVARGPIAEVKRCRRAAWMAKFIG